MVVVWQWFWARYSGFSTVLCTL